MILGGLQKFSLVDYPGKTCAILFTRGCNFRCPYCHNPELVWPERYAPAIDLEDVMAFLRQRRGLLEAVTITGGEPTLQADLIDVVSAIQSMGFAVKLDTNGSHPQTLRELIRRGWVNYVAMDIKAPLQKYALMSDVALPVGLIRESIALLLEGRVDYEFRTTVDPTLLGETDLLEIGQMIRGAKKYYLQKLNRYDSKQAHVSVPPEEEALLQRAAERLREYVGICEVR
jgi:pyruvate formate lyase activating enzyme